MSAVSELLTIVIALQDGAPGGAAADGSRASLEVQSIFDFVVKGGWMMAPIGLCSLIAIAVLFERIISLRRKVVIPPGFLPGLKRVLASGGRDRRKALEYCQRHDSPLARVFAAGIRKLGRPAELIEKHIVEAGQREVLKLRRNLRVLSVVAAVSPLLGLLGTIFGMIKAFQTVAASAEALGRTELLAEGIYEAMITTAAGLIVAIPALVFYHWLSARVERLVMDIDHMTVDFIEEYADPAGATAVTGLRKSPSEALEDEIAPADVAVATT